MRLTREKLIHLRKLLIEYCKEKNKNEIEILTELLITNIRLVSIETSYNNLNNKHITRKIIKTGYGAFGEPESDINYYVMGKYVDYDSSIGLDENEEPIVVSNINIPRLINDVKVEVDKYLDKQREVINNSFDI